MSLSLREALEVHGATCTLRAPLDLVFSTSKGTPLSPRNLYNRALAPACDKLGLPSVSWHSFRHGNATLLGEVGESVKTALAILGHSDIETTLNTYMQFRTRNGVRSSESRGFCAQMFLNRHLRDRIRTIQVVKK
jgi:integrase